VVGFRDKGGRIRTIQQSLIEKVDALMNDTP
jgi:hypothetical protein